LLSGTGCRFRAGRHCPATRAVDHRHNLCFVPPFTTAKISSTASIASLLAPQSPDSGSVGEPSVVTVVHPVNRTRLSDSSSPPNHSVESAARRLLAATSSEGNIFEAGPRRADQPRMRSSIACARCRRSKVKCVNNGVNTTCRDCEAKGRECTYPTPVAGGSAGVPRGDSGNISKPLTDPTSTGEVCRKYGF